MVCFSLKGMARYNNQTWHSGWSCSYSMF